MSITRVLLLWGTFFLKIPVMLFAGLAVALSAFSTYFVSRFSLDKIGALVLINYGYWFLSGFLVHAITFKDFASIDFWNGDGRIFLFYIPLFLFSGYLATRRDIQITINSLALMGLGFVALFIVWAPTHLPLISKGPAMNLVGFLTHHNGQGNYSGYISLFLMIYGYETKKTRYLVIGVLTLLPFLASGSRSSYVGMMGGMGWYLIRKAGFKAALIALLLAALLVVASPFLAPKAYERTAKLFAPGLVAAVWNEVRNSNWEPGQQADIEEDEERNVLMRVIYWVYATKKFALSPIIGIGWGRFNDVHLSMSGFKGWFYVATGGEIVSSPTTAHNSYLHVACETGLLGLLLLGMLWWTIYSRIVKAVRAFPTHSMEKGFFLGCQALILFTLCSSMTTHGLGAPSSGIPLLTVLGIGLSYRRRLAKQAAAATRFRSATGSAARLAT